MKKYILIGIIIIASVLFLLSFMYFNYQEKPEPEELTCDGWGVIFLKPSESHLASEIGRGNTVAVIVSDERGKSNKIIAESDFLVRCGHLFDYNDYLYTEIPEGNINEVIE